MNAQQVRDSAAFKKCADFHGHICPGMSIGFRAAQSAMQRLAEQRSQDEEIVAIVETDACCADPIQVLTGCTFGKGNFIYKDHGKMVMTLLSRKSGKGVRVAMRHGLFAADDEQTQLQQKATAGQATDAERQRLRELRKQRTDTILTMPEHDLFAITEVATELPPKAKMEPSQPCAVCGEPVMGCKLQEVNGQKICRACI